MNCSACSFENPSGTRFCGSCGAALAAACAECGSKTPAGFAFCGQCGAALQGAEHPGLTPPPVRSPRDYTPRHLAERILNQRDALEGERKQVA